MRISVVRAQPNCAQQAGDCLFAVIQIREYQ